MYGSAVAHLDLERRRIGVRSADCRKHAPRARPKSDIAATSADYAHQSENAGGEDREYGEFAEGFVRLAAMTDEDPRRARLRDDLITAHLPLAEHIAKRFRHRGIGDDDLRQVAMIGLINAVDRFDPSRGSVFLAFAVPTIMGEIRRHFRDSAWAVRVPRKLKDLHMRLNRAIGELAQRTGRSPTPREIAAHLGMDLREVCNGLEAGHAYQARSLSCPAPETDSAPPRPEPGGPDFRFDRVDNQAVLHELLTHVDERQREIIALRFFGNMTQTQIACRIGISQMHVSRLIGQTLQELREVLQQQGTPASDW
jgi:RNA polymerase sigma-B factor